MATAKDVVVGIGLDRLLQELLKAVLADCGWAVLDAKSPGAEHASIVLVAVSGSAETIINAVRLARVQIPTAKIIRLGSEETHAEIVRFIEEGVSGFYSTSEGLPAFINLLQMVRDNRVSCSGGVTQLVLKAIQKRSGHLPGAQDRLTAREEEILRLVRDGLGNKEIASRLCISPNTVKNHVHHLLEKLKVRSRHEAAWMRQAPRNVGIFPRIANGG